MRMACASKGLLSMVYVCKIRPPLSHWLGGSWRRRAGGPGGPHPASVGFAVAVHVAGVGLGHLGAVETVQETSGDLRHHGSIWDGLGHAVDRPLKHEGGGDESTSARHSKEMF